MGKYKIIEFIIGCSIDTAVKELKNHNDLVCGEFNGQTLYSDIDDLDSAYKKITGKTKAEFDAAAKAENDRYKKELRKHKESIPELTKDWIEKGELILEAEYHENWKKCVPIRLGDLYRGMELGCTLEIVEKLNNGCELEEAKEIIDGQGHSGMSFSLVRAMIKSLCDRGNEFYNHIQ